MLSLTYTQNALKVEQDRIYGHLRSFQRNIRDKSCSQDLRSRAVLEQLLHQIKRVHLNCSWRRLEVHVLPEIREAGQGADLLLDELESLRLLGRDLYRTARDLLRAAIGDQDVDLHELLQTMSMYCHTMLEMLRKEDDELFALAFGSMAEERWFSIAQRFMQLDKEMLECREVGEVASPGYTEPAHAA